MVLVFDAKGQNKDLIKADSLWDNGEFNLALEVYNSIILNSNFNTDWSMVYYRMGYSYQALFEYEDATKFYLKSYEEDKSDKEMLYLIALAYKSDEKYEEALKYFKEYIKDGEDFKIAAKQHIKSHNIITEWLKTPSEFEVNLNKELSSKHGDFSPCYLNSNNTSMIFTSSRMLDDNKSYKRMNLYYTNKQGNHWSKPVALDTSINKNSEGVICFDQKRNVIFFTSCSNPFPDKKGNCRILYSFLKGDMSGEPLALNWGKADTINNYVTGHPSFSNDLDLLFFASELPGGFGGKDIWFSKYERASDSWAPPVNLGPDINTSGDELFPNISSNGDLYFSSNGKATLGGLDIYKAKKIGINLWGKAENMKPPINSSADDFGIIINENGQSGYFSSARKGGLGMDDIYEFNVKTLNQNNSENTTQTELINSIDVQTLKHFFNKEICSLRVDSLLLTQFKVFPNPSKGEFSIEFNVNHDVPLSIRIYNTIGNVLFLEKMEINEGLFTKKIDLKNEKDGVYYIQILYNCQAIKTEKLIKI